MEGFRILLTRLAVIQIYWNKRKFLHKKKALPQRIGLEHHHGRCKENCFGTPIWPPFHCFGTPIWPP